jgi:hypothetical protein
LGDAAEIAAGTNALFTDGTVIDAVKQNRKGFGLHSDEDLRKAVPDAFHGE